MFAFLPNFCPFPSFGSIVYVSTLGCTSVVVFAVNGRTRHVTPSVDCSRFRLRLGLPFFSVCRIRCAAHTGSRNSHSRRPRAERAAAHVGLKFLKSPVVVVVVSLHIGVDDGRDSLCACPDHSPCASGPAFFVRFSAFSFRAASEGPIFQMGLSYLYPGARIEFFRVRVFST